MRSRPLRIVLLAVVAGALLAAPVAHAWVRKESDRWVWYVPSDAWVDSQSDNSLQLSSPTGALYVGAGFGPTPTPMTHERALQIAVENDGLDIHPVRRLRFIRRGRLVEHEGISRRTYEWVGYRPSRHQRVHGVLTVDVMNDDATFTYGYSLYARVAPVSLWRQWKRKLAFMESRIRLQPRTPDFGF
jgi:hypothetical protein